MGEVTLYWGTMFSGKTTRLINDLIRAGKGAICFKPSIDTRDGEDIIKTHDGIEFPVVTVKSASEIIMLLSSDITTVGIEEASLFLDDPTLIPTIKCIRDMGFNVIITGLDRTSEDEPFYQMPEIAALADNCIKLRTKCHDCLKPASISFFLGKKDSIVHVGRNEYIPLCRDCTVKRVVNYGEHAI